MNKTSNTIYFLIAILAVYFLQGVFYESGGVFTQTLLVVYLLFCGVYFAKTIIENMSNSVAKIITTMVVVLGVSFLLSIKTRYTYSGDEISSFSVYKSICLAMLSFFPFYYFATKGKINVSTMKLFYFAWLVIAIARFFFMRDSIIEESNRDADQIVNNAGYGFVLLLPYSMLVKNRLIKISTITLCMFFIVLAAKRGAIVVGVGAIMVMFYYMFKQSKNIGGFILVLFTVLLIGGVGYYFYESNEYLMSRFVDLSEGNSSGRDVIYTKIWENWLEAPLGSQIFGQGFNASIDIAGKFAHNDWLELLSSLGLFGVIIYVIFFYKFWRYNLKVSDINTRTLLMMTLAIWFVSSIFSMGYVNESFYVLAALMGYVMGNAAIESGNK